MNYKKTQSELDIASTHNATLIQYNIQPKKNIKESRSCSHYKYRVQGGNLGKNYLTSSRKVSLLVTSTKFDEYGYIL